MPGDFKSRLVLGPEGADVSGGNALKVDSALFDRRPNPDQSHRSTYWQRNTEAGYRLAVKETDRGWRGDTYSVFAVPDSMTVEEAAKRAESETPKGPTSSARDAWRPPLVYRSDISGRLWVVFVGEPYEVLGDWLVFAIGPQGLESRCTVEFRPKTQSAVSLLPPAVGVLDRLLDRVVGSGRNEGTLQPTARIRLEVQHTWGNMALRPWALGQPYNTRAQVDAALAEWANGARQNKRLLEDIRAHYQPAERALAAYYQRTFHRSAADATKYAAYALDVAFRAHFVFHKERTDSLEEQRDSPNPWRAE